MAISVTDDTLLRYISVMDDRQKESLLQLIQSFLSADELDVLPTSLKAYNEELNEALERVRQGRFTTLEALEKEISEW